MADNNRIGDITKTSLDSIRAMLDPNTVVGNPIETASGTTIIPISKVSVGYASGGIDYAGKKDVSNKPNNFGGGGGTDHNCVFEYIDRHHLHPGVFVGLSDLFSFFPDKKPPYPVLWVTPEIHGMPPWGKVIALRSE